MLLNKADHVMKYKKIKALIEKAGFYYVGEGRGFGLAEGRNVAYYQKDNYGVAKQLQSICLATNQDDEENILPIFSLNVPEKLRDAVYEIMKEPSEEFVPAQNACIG
ncbi:hypothetical protein Lsai_2808 [Legionella sainthelensi]|uniref:Uncharacterized protein n=2 Tax=Legionella sainthelensi TaxID=28087 RepID=A0A0W0YED7_9GAMM|nr:hypothetical protein Lsai_2808 [Legionella sainthelensi]VEH37255.1 Uncharacterised protein [Legionella sainthelensi]